MSNFEDIEMDTLPTFLKFQIYYKAFMIYKGCDSLQFKLKI